MSIEFIQSIVHLNQIFLDSLMTKTVLFLWFIWTPNWGFTVNLIDDSVDTTVIPSTLGG